MDKSNSIWDELDAAFRLPERQPGDIDSAQMSQRYKVSLGSAQRKMRKIAATGEYDLILVRDQSCQNGSRKVLRLRSKGGVSTSQS